MLSRIVASSASSTSPDFPFGPGFSCMVFPSSLSGTHGKSQWHPQDFKLFQETGFLPVPSLSSRQGCWLNFPLGAVLPSRELGIRDNKVPSGSQKISFWMLQVTAVETLYLYATARWELKVPKIPTLCLAEGSTDAVLGVRALTPVQ